MTKGTINVQTENIFPIIKKFLYSDHEIFLRELVSNAVDATQKLKTFSRVGEFTGELGNTQVEVILDKENKTLTVRDRGIGMSAEEVEKYINQIAFSSAEEFVEKFKTKSEAEAHAIIGHFGLGFYSGFMVSSKVEIFSKSFTDAPAVRWECDGSPNYELEEVEKADRGTDIVLHIDDESAEFLEEQRIKGLLEKYCRFLPVEIVFGTEKTFEEIEGEKDEDGNPKTKEVEKIRVINNPDPIWKKSPSGLSDEDYTKFYSELYPYTFDQPLFHIHLNVDYPFNLTGVLYFPKVKNNFEVQKNKIQLYSNQVFVTDSVEGIVPDFLTLLHGVIDSPDIPLNVSRSYLQSDASVKKISSHITKKVADKLEELFKNDRAEFEKKWDDIKVFIEYGMITDEKFNERAHKFSLFKNVDGKYFTFEEYKEHIQELQTNKDGKVVYLYTSNQNEQYSYIETAKERGYDVMIMDGVLDSHFINNLETKLENSTFVRVDADIIDKLIQKEDSLPSKLSDEQKESVKMAFEKELEKGQFAIQFENLGESDMPVMLTRPEFMRRMKEMQSLGGGAMMMGDLPDSYNFVINTNHKLITDVIEEKEEIKQKQMVSQLKDLALLSQNLLTGEALNNFIKRSVEIIK
ncbi:MAG: molecular chaperone HtpG [Bacteroidales bacterium]|nr:molecular chaperone HtpG [Bacteroidales bacterium]